MAFLVLDKFEPKDPTALPKILRKSLIDWEGEEPGSNAGSFCMVQNNTEAPAESGGIITASKDGFSLVDGVIVSVTLKYPMGSLAKLNINNTGAKSIVMRSGATTKNRFLTYDTLTFMYDEGYGVWRIISYDTFAESESSYGICRTATNVDNKEINISGYILAGGNILMVKFTNAVSQTAAKTYLRIAKGDGTYTDYMQIKYQDRGTTLPITAGCTATFVIVQIVGGYYLDLQGINEVGEEPQKIVIQDSNNYDLDDDEAVPTCNAASAIAVYRINEKMWVGTQEQYDAITTKDADTFYFIRES